MLHNFAKFSFHHRAFYCYIFMLLWILCLVVGMYRYVNKEEISQSKQLAREKKRDKFDEIFSDNCNPPSEIVIGAEGINDEDTWMLQGVILLTRHGDRGPLTHVQSGDEIHCNKPKTSDIFKAYQAYLWNSSLSGKAPWVQTPGPFHNFPSIPTLDRVACPLGQLTFTGVEQSLQTGYILRKVYAEKLGWSESLESKVGIRKIDVETQSTRYRRTFQSALAVLWALLPAQVFPSVASSIKESHSVLFCYNDCVCPASEYLSKKISNEKQIQIKNHYVKKLAHKIAKVIFDVVESEDVYVLKDAVLAYICHHSALPCRELPIDEVPYILKDGKHMKNFHGFLNSHAKSDFLVNRNLLESEIELDIDYNNPGSRLKFEKNMKPKALLDFDSQMEIEKLQYFQEKGNVDDEDDISNKQTHIICIEKEHLYPLFDYIKWSSSFKSNNLLKQATLNAYGLLIHIVQYFIRIISDGKPKFVLYSGHDRSLNSLILALGSGRVQQQNIHYLSRFIFEIYKKKAVVMDYNNSDHRKEIAQDFYFRVLFNGLDMTDQLKFCQDKYVTMVDNSITRGRDIKFLCPIERIVRFVHDDYFLLFNATNYKDACAVNK